MELLIAQYLPLIIKYGIAPAIIALTKANPTLDDAGILAKLPADLLALVTPNQAFLDSIRAQAGR